MKLHFAISVAAFATVCFSVPRTSSAADKTDFSFRKALTKLLPEGYFDNERKSKILDYITFLRQEENLISSRQGGLTGERCSSSADCREPRTCQTFPIIGIGDICLFPNLGGQRCDGSSGCSSGERCFDIPNVGRVCGSPTAVSVINEILKDIDPDLPLITTVDDASGSGDPCACIGSHLLTHLSRNELVFEKDTLSNVLCDEHNSCATPGHMVTYHGKGMMMKSYCEMIGGCVEKVMFVNSPRYSVKGTLPSLSENMAFTAFSARFVTRAEERILSIAIRMGF